MKYRKNLLGCELTKFKDKIKISTLAILDIFPAMKNMRCGIRWDAKIVYLLSFTIQFLLICYGWSTIYHKTLWTCQKKKMQWKTTKNSVELIELFSFLYISHFLIYRMKWSEIGFFVTKSMKNTSFRFYYFVLTATLMIILHQKRTYLGIKIATKQTTRR